MKSSRLAILAVAALCIVNSPAKAQTFNKTSGTYSWNDTGNWGGGVVPQNAGDSATFASLSGGLDVTFDAPTIVGSILVNNNNNGARLTLGNGGESLTFNTVSGNANLTVGGTSDQSIAVLVAADITLNKSLNIVVNNTDSVTGLRISGVIEGSGQGIIKSGSGNLSLTGANTYTGGTTINAGTLTLGVDEVLADTGAVTITGGTLAIGTRLETVGAVTVSGGNITGTSGILTADSYSFTNAGLVTVGAILEGGVLTKSGAGTLRLTGTNNYTSTTISGGTLQIGNNGTTGSVEGNIVNNATLVFSRSNALTYGYVISGTGTVTKQGLGNLTLSNANTYTGATTISGGTLSLGTTGSINNSTSITVGSGATYSVGSVTGGYQLGSSTAQTLGGVGTVSGAVTVNALGTIRGDTGTGTGTLTTGNVTINSGGTLAAALGTTGVNSKLALGSNTLNLSVGGDSVLKLTSTGFDRSFAGTYNIATLTGNLQINGVTQTGPTTLGTYIVGTPQSGSDAVTIDVSALNGLMTGDLFVLSYGGTGSNVVLNFTPVPEPTTVLAIAVGALGCGGLVRRRFRKVADSTAAV